jgi:Raf kinase inhibitor-like YbhB/YbcL family protein
MRRNFSTACRVAGANAAEESNVLEKTPSRLGEALQGVRAGAADLAVAHTELTGINASVEISSAAFEYNEVIPSRYTADGEGLSPPLEWHGVPANTAALVLLIEDADSPTPHPLVHAIAWDLPTQDGSLPEGALRNHAGKAETPAGRNSYLQASYLPPDPPSGHGPHRYVFQLFALDRPLSFASPPGRGELLDALRGHVLAKGLLIGLYERK